MPQALTILTGDHESILESSAEIFGAISLQNLFSRVSEPGFSSDRSLKFFGRIMIIRALADRLTTIR